MALKFQSVMHMRSTIFHSDLGLSVSNENFYMKPLQLLIIDIDSMFVSFLNEVKSNA